jgi:DNA-binding NarL/FixJ family response regulator
MAFRRHLDVAAYEALLNGMSGLHVVVAAANLDACVASCQTADVDVALLDATFPRLAAFEAAQSLLSHGGVPTVAFLDDHFAIVRAERALAIPNSTYLTRQNDFAPVLRELSARLDSSTDFHGRAVISTGPRSVHFAQSLKDLKHLDRTGYLSLTKRERQILAMLANGMSPKEIAEQLTVALKTIDNHKVRLMKKLRLRKHPQISSIALQVGLLVYP